MSDEPEPAVERWIFAGSSVGSKGARVHRWVDAGGRDLYFKPVGSPGIGGIYELKAVRHDDGRLTRYGDPNFTGDSIDRNDARRIEWAADSRIAETALQVAAVERKLRTDDALNDAIDPLVEIARRLPAAQRTALAAIILRRIEGQAWR